MIFFSEIMILCALFLLPPGAPLQGPLGVPGVKEGSSGAGSPAPLPRGSSPAPSPWGLGFGWLSAFWLGFRLGFRLDFRFLAWIWLRISALA